jgi:Carboxypeptidase regulatory-like domain
MRKLTLLSWGILMLSLASFWNLPAQEVVAHIRGTVTDPSGAGVPGAEVRAINTQTRVSATVTTKDDGGYEFLSLAPGKYEVIVTKDGFRTSTAHNIVLTLNQIYDLPFALQVGELTQSVQVDANPTQVETSTTQLGTIIDAKQIVDLPLLGRNWTQLQQLVPGAVAQSDANRNNYAINGSESQQNSFLLNGADAVDYRLNAVGLEPSPDAIDQFNLIDSTINAEYGRNSGGILNAIVKSGTNQFHGSAFEFYRDTFLNARNFFSVTPPVFHQNQYGGTVGGPIWKDHTFFFLSYQGTRNRRPDTNQTSETTTVFTQAERDGYFPDIATSTALSPVAMVGENGATFAAGTPYNVLFPTGHIPSADLNPLAVKLMNQFVPLPNFGANQYSFTSIATEDFEQGIARVDHTFGTKDSVWASLFIEHDSALRGVPFLGSTLPGFGETDPEATKEYTAQWSHTFNPTTLNEFRASWYRLNYEAVTPENPALPSSYGFSGINSQFPSVASMPLVSLNGYFNLGGSPAGPQPSVDNTYEMTESVSKVVGSHTMKFGFDWRRYEINDSYDALNNGEFAFNGTGPYSTGDPGADFLLGVPDEFIQESGGVQAFRSYEFYSYAQDSWKVRKDLTLNYGIGWQIDTPLVNHRYDGLYNNCFIPGQQSTIFPTAPVGLDFPGDPGCTTSGYHQHNDNFAPRFGFAYSPEWGALSGGTAKKFVIRGGYGIYFNRAAEELALQQLGAPPFFIASVAATGIGGSPTFANPYVDIATGKVAQNPFPFTGATKGENVNFSQFEPLSISTVNPNLTDAYAMNYNLNIQRELPGQMILQVGYVGAQGRHLDMVYEGNPISPAGTAACAADPTCIANRDNQAILYPSHSMYAPGNIFASVGVQGSPGVSNYNSLQVQLQKRLARGLMFQAAYTWSHSIDDTSGYEGSGAASGSTRTSNPFDFALNKGDSNFDARHRFVVNYTYELPIPRWNNPFGKYVLNGWRVAGITTLQTGFPIIVGDSSDLSLQCPVAAPFSFYGCWDAPNVAGSPSIYNPRNATLQFGSNPAQPNYYFNPNAFAQETPGVLGNEGRNNFHGPGINNTDLALSKLITFTETKRIELRLEAFNVFNHTNFAFSQNITAWEDYNAPSTFGRVTTYNPNAAGRVVQLGAKIYF